MRRILAILLVLLLSPSLAIAQRLVPATPDSQASTQSAWLVPVWRASNGHLMAALPDDPQLLQSPLRLVSDDGVTGSGELLNLGGGQSSAGISLEAGTRMYSSLRFSSVSSPVALSACRGLASPVPACLRARQPSWRGGALSGGFRGNGLLIDLGLDWMQHAPRSGGLLLVVPDTEHVSVMGIPSQWIDSLNRVRASGSVQLGEGGTHLDMGASVGRISLLPGRGQLSGTEGPHLFSGYTPGMESIDQKSLSIGLGRGAISGSLVGRVMQPDGPGRVNSALMQQWSAVDLGITLRLPWEGELSLGAQNLWSSGDKAKLPSPDRDPAQSRIPYIQYHQEL